MAAGLGFKDFVTGEVLTANDVDGYLMQGVWVFADAAARTAAVTSPQEGNMSYLKDTNSTEYYSGSAWVAVGAAGGGMTLLSTTTLSGASTTVSVGSGYNSILGIVFGVTNNTGNGRLYIAPNGTTNQAQLSGVARYPSTSNLYGVSNGYIDLTIGYDTLRTSANNSFQFQIHNYTSSTAYKNITGCAVYVNNDSANQSTNLAGGFSDNTAITSLVFSQSGGNFSAGTVLLYGVK